MKHLFILFLFSCTSLFAQNYPSSPGEEPFYKRLSLTASVKLANNISLSRQFDNSVLRAGPAYSAGFEVQILHDDKRNAGAGVEYQFSNSVFGIDGSYHNIPVYLFYQLSLVHVKYLTLPAIHVQLGYNFLLIDDKFPFGRTESESGNGIYYALGFSSDINEFLNVRLLYSVNQGTINFNGDKYLFSNDKISVVCAVSL